MNEKELIESRNENFLNLCLRQVWRCAFALFLEFVIALEDYLSILAVGMPYLRTKPATAVPTLDF